MSGLVSAVSGIRANQTALAVISNNLANINTVAFKESNVDFKTVFADTLQGSTAPSSSSGGVNPEQIGNGVAIADISINHSQGGSLTTGRNTDFLISGEGYFTLAKKNSDGTSTTELTRAGNFSLDALGNLVNSQGHSVMGTNTVDGNNTLGVAAINVPRDLTVWKEVSTVSGKTVQTWIGAKGSTTVTSADMSDPANTFETQNAELTNFSIGNDGSVTGTYSNGDRISVQNDATGKVREVTHLTAEGINFSVSGFNASGTSTIVDNVLTPQQLQVRLATVTNPDGLTYDGDNNWQVSSNSGDIQYGVPNNGSRGALQSGALESSNVDIASQFTNMIVAQRGLEAASKAITVNSDVLRTIIGII